MPVALKRRRTDGTLYERPPDIEAQIEGLEKSDATARLRQFHGNARKHSDYVPTEIVLYFLRQAWAAGDRVQFESLFRILVKRVDHSLQSALPDARMDNAAAIRDEVRGRLVEMLSEDCAKPQDRLDFFEIRFDSALAALRTTVLRKMGPATNKTVPLGDDASDGPSISSEVEQAAIEFWGFEPSILDDPAFRSVLYAAIDQLPQEQQQVVVLLLKGIPIDAKEKDVTTIARILQCDERTVRNRRDRAYKAIRAAIEKEATC